MDRSKWEYKKLGEVGAIITGGTPPTKDARNYSSDDYCFVKPSDLTDERILFLDDSEFHVSSYAYSNSRKLPKGAVLVCCIGSIGKLGILNVDATCNQQINAIIPKSEFNSKYIAYCLLASKGVMLNIANAPVVPIINKSQFSNIEIMTCPIDDQQRVVAELDCLNEMIAVKQEQLKEFDKLAQSIFYDMFGDPSHNEKQWELKSLKEISNEKLSYGSGASAVTFDGQTRYIRITDINDNGELNEDIVSPSVYDEKYLLNDGDILFARSGATVGKTYCHNSKYGQCIYAGYLIRLVPNKELVLPSYVYSYTKTPYYRSFVEAAQRAVAQPNINAKQYGDLLICVPPLSLQQQFAEKISAIEAQKELVKQSIAETQYLLEYTMDKYFG